MPMRKNVLAAVLGTFTVACGSALDGVAGPTALRSSPFAATHVTPASVAPIDLVPSSPSAFGQAITDYGAVAGNEWISSPTTVYKPFVWLPSAPRSSSGQLHSFAARDFYRPSAHAFDINNRGLMTGWTAASGALSAFVWIPPNRTSPTGRNVRLPRSSCPSGQQRSLGKSINAAGQIVGYAIDPALSCVNTSAAMWVPQAFWSSTYTLSFLDGAPAGCSLYQPNSINHSGQVVGLARCSSTPAAGTESFVWTPSSRNGISGQASLLAGLGGTQIFAAAINDGGQIAGAATDASGVWHAVLWTPTQPGGHVFTLTDLGFAPGQSDGGAESINNLGQVVGGSVVSFSAPFLWSPTSRNGMVGTMVPLATIGPANFGKAHDINDAQQVIGRTYTSTFELHMTMWMPTGYTPSNAEVGRISAHPATSPVASPAGASSARGAGAITTAYTHEEFGIRRPGSSLGQDRH